MLFRSPLVTLRIAVDGPVVEAVLSDLGDDAHIVAENPDGGVEIEIAVSVPGALRTHLLGYLEAVELLAPESERSALIERLGAIAGAQ